jgi:hypothetical protein
MTPNPDAGPAGGPPSEEFTALDWVRLLVAGGSIAALVAFPVGEVEKMFRDFGVYDSLPLLTRIVLWPWCQFVLALPAAISLEVGLWVRHRPALRRRWMLVAVVLGVLGLAVCVAATFRVVIPAACPPSVGAA